MTCGCGKTAGQRVAQALICKQEVAGSSPAVSTTAGLRRKVACVRPDPADYEPITADELERLRRVERAAGRPRPLRRQDVAATTGDAAIAELRAALRKHRSLIVLSR